LPTSSSIHRTLHSMAFVRVNFDVNVLRVVESAMDDALRLRLLSREFPVPCH
jgi:hypothetical protein